MLIVIKAETIMSSYSDLTREQKELLETAVTMTIDEIVYCDE